MYPFPTDNTIVSTALKQGRAILIDVDSNRFSPGSRSTHPDTLTTGGRCMAEVVSATWTANKMFQAASTKPVKTLPATYTLMFVGQAYLSCQPSIGLI